MSARDELVALLTTTQVATDFYGDDAALMPGPAERLADAILAAGWVPADRLRLVRDSVRDVSDEARAERDLMRADLGDLLNALNMGDHARPQSPHEVMQEAIERVRALASGRCIACMDASP